MTILTGALVIVVSVVAATGLVVAVWSIVNTRRKYYDEYISRRKHSTGD